MTRTPINQGVGILRLDCCCEGGRLQSGKFFSRKDMSPLHDLHLTCGGHHFLERKKVLDVCRMMMNTILSEKKKSQAFG